jgi:putative heme-binding domain-containing protein
VKAKLINTVPARGGFSIQDPKIIKPGDRFGSALYHRIAKFGRGRMPHIGSELIDERGVELIGAWIDRLKHDGTMNASTQQRDREKTFDRNSVERSFGSWREAHDLARAVAGAKLPDEVRDRALTLAAAHGDRFIRDLFEGYQPIDRRVQSIGVNPNMSALLALKGEPTRGYELFWNAAGLQCRTCHQINGVGGSVGPDLSDIGAKRSKAELLESMLEPSKKVEPAFTSYLAQLRDGSTTQGVRVKTDERTTTLRGAKNELIELKLEEIESIKPSTKSIMPEGLMKDLTADQAADLLEYLSSLKSQTKPAKPAN